jgi:CHAD domain-containing protein
LHEARKAVKRARYAVEVVAPVTGGPAVRLVGDLTAAQELLGDQHDTVTARERLRHWARQAEAAGETSFSYGLLYGRQQALAERLEADLPALVAASAKAGRRRFLR